MSRVILFLISLFLINLNTACVSSGSSKTLGTATQKEMQVDYPFWVENPNLNGFIGISTSAGIQKIGGIEGQRRVAMVKAKAEYSRILKTSIQASTSIIMDDSGVTQAQDRSKISSGTAFNFGEAFVKEEWIHPVSQDLYIWLLVPRK